MAQLGYIDPTAEERRSDSFDPLPDGWYPAQIIESDVVPTKAGTGQMFTATLEIIDGQFAKRRAWDRINIVNQSPDAQRIGQSQLRQLAEALGFSWPLAADSDTQMFEFKPLEMRIGRQKDDRNKNEVKAYRAYGSAVSQMQAPASPAAQPQRTAPPPQQQASAAGNRPWAR